LGLDCGLPAFWISPATCFSRKRALIVSYDLGWWFDRDFHGVTGSECDPDADRHAGFILPESPVAAGLSYLDQKSFLLREVRSYLSGKRLALQYLQKLITASPTLIPFHL